MRTLLYVPIIHTSADLGSLAKEVTRRGMMDLGEEIWRRHEEIVLTFWNGIIKYFDSGVLPEVAGFKIYQDGMVADGEVGQKMVEDGVKLGSKNYEVVLKLLQKGAILVRTEDFNLVREERDWLLKITRVETPYKKLLALIKYKFAKTRLLNKRDQFISRRIAETLNDGDTGIIFIGAYHNIKHRLPGDINIIEIKDVDRVREYHQLLPFYRRHRERLEELSRYLASEIN